MDRIYSYIFLILFCFSPLSYSDEPTVASLIRGVNQARLQIQSGEARFTLTINHAAEKSEAEIAAWRQQEKERELKAYRPNPYLPGRDPNDSEGHFKEFKQYLTEQLDWEAEWYRQRLQIQASNVAFQILGEDFAFVPKVYQYKMTIQDRLDMEPDSRKAQHLQAGWFRLITHDTQKQVKEGVGNVVLPMPTVQTFDSNYHGGFLHLALHGRSAHRVPNQAKWVGKETIDGAVCDILEFSTERFWRRIWVDGALSFCVRQMEARKDSNAPLFARGEYKDFRRFGDVWYPVVTQFTSYKNDGTIKQVTTVEVKEAEFNVDFPKDFFKIDLQFYKGRGNLLGPKTPFSGSLSPTKKPQTEAEILLLSCGPQSLLRVCEILDVETNLRELKKLSGFDPTRGTTMLGLKEAATYKGLTPKGVKANLKGLKKNKVPLPAIAYVDGNHFLVFEAVQRDGVRISDPANKYNPHLSWKALSKIWEGELLIFDAVGQPSTPEPVPLAFAPEAEYDFGKALGGSEIKHTFAIQNIGQKPLKILSVTETCACTAAIVSQHEIPAGANGMIEAVLKVPSENAPVEENITIFTDDPTQNTVILTLKGQAFIPLKTFPERLAFGNQKHFQSPLTKKVSLHVQSEVQILGVRTDSEHLRAKLDEGQIPHVEVQLLPNMPVGQFSRSLLVDYRYKGKQTTHDVLIFGEVLGAFRVTPKRFFFGLIKDPEAISKTITISSLNDQPFHLTSVESNSEAVIATVEKTADEMRYHLTVTIHPEASSGELSGEILLKTSSPIQPTLRVPFFGIIGE